MDNQNPQPFYRKSTWEYEFSPTASEITILDRRGQIVWRQRRADEVTPICWRGMDLHGTHVSVGSYTCKIMYSNNPQAVYLPFVFMHE
jgi:hypothetical protein